MPDDLSIRRPQDPTKINVHEDWEIRYWCKKWSVTPDQLRAAVKAVGVSTKAVAAKLGKQP
ncbi:MAG: DUF3606 domain-containing protein [Methylobacteriaceae bacterium]|nr:DUF3606 domain-containing protein [Methylobacteriaceae bacterium]